MLSGKQQTNMTIVIYDASLALYTFL